MGSLLSNSSTGPGHRGHAACLIAPSGCPSPSADERHQHGSGSFIHGRGLQPPKQIWLQGSFREGDLAAVSLPVASSSPRHRGGLERVLNPPDGYGGDGGAPSPRSLVTWWGPASCSNSSPVDICFGRRRERNVQVSLARCGWRSAGSTSPAWTCRTPASSSCGPGGGGVAGSGLHDPTTCPRAGGCAR